MSLTPREIGERYQAIRMRIDDACRRAGRDPNDVTLLAVSKAHSIENIRAAFEAGCLDFGESRVQEWRKKAPALPSDIRWHLIGHLQRNKAKYVANAVHLIHSVSSLSLVDAIERRAERPQDVLLEVNLAAESRKAGVAVEGLEDLALRCVEDSTVRPVGLMCIPPYTEDAEQSRVYYEKLSDLLSELRDRVAERDREAASGLTQLSMGMTHDFEVAVEEGATIVRVGTAIFGTRPAVPIVMESQ